MRIGELTNDEAVVGELGRRLAAHRIERNLTQSELADAAGVARSTVQRIEGGGSIQLASLVRIMRSLHLLDELDAALPATIELPLAEFERRYGRARRRVRHGTRSSGTPTPDDAPWRWGDEDAPG